MDFRVSVDFARARLKETCAITLGAFETMQCAEHAGERREDGIPLVVRRARRACQIPDPVEATQLGPGLGDIVGNQTKAPVVA